MTRALAALGWLALVPASVTILAASLDRLHPMLDSLGVGLLYGLIAAVIAILALAAARARRAVALAIGLVVVALGQVLPVAGLAGGAPPTEPLRLIQHNLKFHNRALDLPERIAEADIVTLQEIRRAGRVLAHLPPGWSVHGCQYASVGRPGVLTSLPVIDHGCLYGGTWVRVDTASGPLTVVSLHLRWPWPYGHAEQVTENLPDLRALPRPVVVAGDFNQTPWSWTATRIAEATDTKILPSLATTLPILAGLVRLNIDHVLVPEDWTGTVQTTAQYGSDHFALAADIGPVRP